MWFKVDDGFWCHPKTLALTPHALALWVRAGSWCAQQLTDGHVPKHALAVLQGRPKDAAELVDHGLWKPADAGGWQFHDWHAYQWPREKVLAERAASAARVAAWRANRRNGKGTGEQPPDEQPP